MDYYLDSEKIWKLNEIDEKKSQGLEVELGVSRLTSVFLTNRGMSTVEDANRFLHPSQKQLTDPIQMPGLKKAVIRIKQAIKDDELIFIHGDYDVDGVTSTTLLFEVLQKLKAKVQFHIPCRFKDGYGLKKKTIDLVSKSGAKLLITVDCGIKNFEEVDYAATKGIDVIITDHHEPDEKVPDAFAVIDPKITGSDVDNSYLAGVGVALKLAQLICDDPLEEYFDLVALGSIADLAPLIEENRYLAKRGLEVLNKNTRPGIASLAKLAGKSDQSITSEVIGFTLAPRINAGGRMANANICVDLLTTKDENIAAEIALTLEKANRKRQELQEHMLEETLNKIEKEVDLSKEKVIFVADGRWHDGIKGIIASRIKERFYRPAFIGTIKDNLIQASGRSIPKYSMNEVLSKSADLLEDFGGHDKACGVTVSQKNLPQFKKRLNELADEMLDEKDLHPIIEIESKSSLLDFTSVFENEFKLMAPFGEGNRLPKVLIEDVYLQNQQRLGSKGSHLTLDLFKEEAKIKAIGFGVDSFSTVVNHQGKADLVVQPEINEYKNRLSFRLNINDLKLKALSFEDPKSVIDHLFANRQAIASNQDYKNIGDADSFNTKLVGVTHDGRQDIIKKLKKKTQLVLVRESENIHDPNAIRVLSQQNDDIGFLNKRLAKQLSPLIDAGIEYSCVVSDVTGQEQGKNTGVNVIVQRNILNNELDVNLEKKSFENKSTVELLEIIRKTLLGENQYHQFQKEALDSLLDGNNTLSIMGTGRGKSAIFHTLGAYKAIHEKNLSIFLYPLRALIADQYIYLKEAFSALGLNVIRLSSDCLSVERQKLFDLMSKGKIDIVLTTPEFIHHNIGEFNTIKERIGFLVVDEAHHLSTSGKSHRPLYGQIDEYIETLEIPLVMAATATANKENAEIIQNKLKIEKVVIDKTVRTNLNLIDQREITDKELYLKDLINKGKKLLIYVNSREKGAELANNLRFIAKEHRGKIVYYHAGLNSKLRHAVQDGFANSTFKVVVATSAFGEGVNIGDITDVALFHLPFSFIEYNQQSGRCGRDGQEASIHLLFGDEDARINEFILESKACGRENLVKIWKMITRLASDNNIVSATTEDVANHLNIDQPGCGINKQTVNSCFKIFCELGLIDIKNEAGEVFIEIFKDKKVDLQKSAIYEEGLHEKEQFLEFKEWAFSSNEDVLLKMINQPIYPKEEIDKNNIEKNTMGVEIESRG